MDKNVISSRSGSRVLVQVQATFILLVLACLLPFFVHMIPPYRGIPIGAFLLPMFYVPFIALVFYRLYVGLIIAVLAPIINFLLVGSPDWQIITILTIELGVFTLIAYLLLQGSWNIVSAPLAYLLTKTVSSLLLFLSPIIPFHPME